MTKVSTLERYFNYVSNVMPFIKFKSPIIAQSPRKGDEDLFRTLQNHTYVTLSTSLMQNDCKKTIFLAMRHLIPGVSTMWTKTCQVSAVHWAGWSGIDRRRSRPGAEWLSTVQGWCRPGFFAGQLCPVVPKTTRCGWDQGYKPANLSG